MSTSSTDQLLTRRVSEIIDQKHLAERLERGDKLRVKFGIDPSKPDIHIGHAIPIQKLREFQDAGHTAVLLIGDYTAQIGDPTDRSEARKMLSKEEVAENAKTYLGQVRPLLDPTKTEVRYQSEWFGTFDLRDVIELMASTTVNNLLSHETFANRLKASYPLHAHEILYPLLQGFDSVALKADVEIGGIDQKFNMLMGRTVQRVKALPEQDVITVRYLPGVDGQAKMSKSLGNTINLTDSPSEMFGRVMSIPDSLIPVYFELATEEDEATVGRAKERLAAGENLKMLKEELALAITTLYHGAEQGRLALDGFNKVFRDKQVPDEIETLIVAKTDASRLSIVDMLVKTSLATSKSEARRLVAQNAVSVDRHKINDSEARLPAGEEHIIQVGPRRFVRVKVRP